MVYGFVKQSNGHIKIYSEPGAGTSLKSYLPKLAEALEAIARAEHIHTLPRGAERILVVEDDELVRRYAMRQLQALGYRVLEATNGPEALQIIQNHVDINLLFTDVVMPGGMNGRQLADAACAIHPDLKVLYTSGYAGPVVDRFIGEGTAYIIKPFSDVELSGKVRERLDGSS